VQFSHEHHVAGLGIDCRYCHTSVEESSYAGIPATETCMQCHSQIWADSPKLFPVRESFKSNNSLEWNRVYDLPDYAYFNHVVHIKKGVGCATCHGPVNEMPLTWREHTLHMKWCLECHRNPEEYLRPLDRVFAMDWKPEETGKTQSELGAELVEQQRVDTSNLTNCSICHR
jgi:hypothetical protein